MLFDLNFEGRFGILIIKIFIIKISNDPHLNDFHILIFDLQCCYLTTKCGPGYHFFNVNFDELIVTSVKNASARG